VVNSYTNFKRDLVPKGIYAGLVKDAIVNNKIDLLKEISWTPSHTELKPDASPEEALTHMGNDLVDKAAGKIREELEEAVGKELLDDAESRGKLAVSILKGLGALHALWPALPKAMARKVREPTDTLKVDHSWVYSPFHQYWKCQTCGTFKHGQEAEGPPRKSGKCQPGRTLERCNRSESLGHTLSSVVINGTITYFCTRCAARGSWQWRRLLDPCQEVPKCQADRNWLRAAMAGGKELQADFIKAKKAANPPESRVMSPAVGEGKGIQRTSKRTRSSKPSGRSTSPPRPSVAAGRC